MSISLCFSVATNLRCAGLTRSQGIAILVLPAIELVFGLMLAKFQWGGDKNRWLLVIEGIVYFLLALADFLLHETARVNPDVATFEIYDKAIGVFSLFPIFLYTGYLFLICRKDFLPLAATRRVKLIAQFSLMSLILPLIIFHELASLNGLAYAKIDNRLLVGYTSGSSKTASLFFGSFTLAILGGFQALVGFGCLFYIIRVRGGGHGGGVIYGFGWVATGLLLGTVESFMGFSAICFALIFARRLVRLFGRVALIIGLLLGTSSDEGFALFPNFTSASLSLGRNKPPPPPRIVISHPQSDSFAHLTPNATSFYSIHNRSQGNLVTLFSDSNPFSDPDPAILRIAHPMSPIENIPPPRPNFSSLALPVENVPSSRKGSLGWVTPPIPKTKGFIPFSEEQAEMVDLFGKRNKPQDRVTVHFRGENAAPVLQMRLSDLDMPSPSALMRTAISPQPSIDEDERDSLRGLPENPRGRHAKRRPQSLLQMQSLRKALKSADHRARQASGGSELLSSYASGSKQGFVPLERDVRVSGRFDMKSKTSRFSILPTRTSYVPLPTPPQPVASSSRILYPLPPNPSRPLSYASSFGSDTRGESMEAITSHPGSWLRHSNTSVGRGRLTSSPMGDRWSERTGDPFSGDLPPLPATMPYRQTQLYLSAQPSPPDIAAQQYSRWSTTNPTGSDTDHGHLNASVGRQSRWSNSSTEPHVTPQAVTPTGSDGYLGVRPLRQSVLSSLDSPASDVGQIQEVSAIGVRTHWSTAYALPSTRSQTSLPMHSPPEMPMPTASTNNPFAYDVYSTTHESSDSRHMAVDMETMDVLNYGFERVQASTPQLMEGIDRESVALEHDRSRSFEMEGYRFPIPEEQEQEESGHVERGRSTRYDSQVLGEEDRELVRTSVNV